jgi:hypothetical protein
MTLPLHKLADVSSPQNSLQLETHQSSPHPISDSQTVYGIGHVYLAQTECKDEKWKSEQIEYIITEAQVSL